ncbi:4-hydroxybenzoate octaprenyltransferase [bacterium]|nr:4-hydroxybenzoate octaprenyltransferase [bacterium]
MSRRLSTFLEAIKFSHSVFALPFALVAMVVAANGIPSLWTITFIVIACVAARTAAMAFNRIADRRFDARNPRTAKRALVTGELTVGFMWKALLASAGVFFFAALMLNGTCFLLSPPTLAILLAYSYMKRVTPLAHIFLGLALGLAPIGAWIAVTESIAWAPVWLALAVLTWVAGFDVLYSCQDYDVDRAEKALHSIPKRLGIAGAMRFAAGLHIVAAILFFIFWWSAGLGTVALCGVFFIALLLQRQHAIVSPNDLSRIDAAFFTLNGYIAIGFFAMVLMDVLRAA